MVMIYGKGLLKDGENGRGGLGGYYYKLEIGKEIKEKQGRNRDLKVKGPIGGGF